MRQVVALSARFVFLLAVPFCTGTISGAVAAESGRPIAHLFVEIENPGPLPAIVIRVNGLPVVEHDGVSPGLGTMFDVWRWLVNGANEISAEVPRGTNTRDLKVSLQSERRMASDSKPQGYERQMQTLGTLVWADGSPFASTPIHLSDLPTWSWQRAARWDHDRIEVVEVLKEMREAYATADVKTIESYYQIARADDRAVFSPAELWPPGPHGTALETFLFYLSHIDMTLEGPPVDLIYETFLDERVIRVRDLNGNSPLKFRVGSESGGDCCGIVLSKIDGRWQLLDGWVSHWDPTQ